VLFEKTNNLLVRVYVAIERFALFLQFPREREQSILASLRKQRRPVYHHRPTPNHHEPQGGPKWLPPILPG